MCCKQHSAACNCAARYSQCVWRMDLWNFYNGICWSAVELTNCEAYPAAISHAMMPSGKRATVCILHIV